MKLLKLKAMILVPAMLTALLSGCGSLSGSTADNDLSWIQEEAGSETEKTIKDIHSSPETIFDAAIKVYFYTFEADELIDLYPYELIDAMADHDNAGIDELAQESIDFWYDELSSDDDIDFDDPDPYHYVDFYIENIEIYSEGGSISDFESIGELNEAISDYLEGRDMTPVTDYASATLHMEGTDWNNDWPVSAIRVDDEWYLFHFI